MFNVSDIQLTNEKNMPDSSNDDEWNKFAPSYMKLATDGFGVVPAQNMVKVASEAFHFSSASTILDIGCGPGQVTAAVLEVHGSELPETSRVVALDLSPGMIQQVENRKKTEIENGDTLWNKVEPMTSFVLFMVPQARVALNEIHRVLTNENGGGIVALSSWQASEWMELMSFVSKVRPEKSAPKMPSTWGTLEGVRGELEATGFRDIEVHTVESFMQFNDYDEITRFILTQFPGMNKMTSDMSREELEKVRKLMVEFIKSRHPVTPGRLTGIAIVGVGRK
ncbi:S-adenosyl-L-methionine-dependent methyltransferase [Lipomyces orientalis]|uniref:S-adenosyl-L-methionine-dependent methyltransferase n=1 Tax=Lipomyces orientalis TaxID=1233043 RepID=A0ACC3TKS7_9ASCO